MDSDLYRIINIYAKYEANNTKGMILKKLSNYSFKATAMILFKASQGVKVLNIKI